MDNREDKIAVLVKCIQELGVESPLTTCLSTPEAKASHDLRTWVNNVESNLHLAKEEVEPLTPSPGLDRCLLLQLKEQVGSIRTDLLGIIQDILSSENEDEDLYDKKDRLCKALFKLDLQIKRLLHDQLSSPSTPENESKVQLLKIYVPVF